MKSFVDFYNSTAIISHAICNIKFMESKVMLATRPGVSLTVRMKKKEKL